VDWWVIGGYLSGTLALSAWLARRQRSAADYYVGGRALPAWALGISILATQSSANSFIGIPAYVALVPGGGLTWLQYELAVPLAMIVVMLLLVPVLRGMGVISVYEYLEHRFDRRTRLLLSVVFLLSRGPGHRRGALRRGLDGAGLHRPGLGVGHRADGGITVVYDTLGGMRAVVWTDVIQMAVLLGGIALCFLAGLGSGRWWRGHPGGSRAQPPGRIGAQHGLGDGARAPLWGFLAGGLVLYISYYGVDQSQAQRTLSATICDGRAAALLLNGLLRFPLTLAYAGLGLAIGAMALQQPALREAVPGNRPDLLVPRFIELYLPSGARGLLVAAILAAAMSSLDSALNSLSAATLRDFVEPRVGTIARTACGSLVTVAWGVVPSWLASRFFVGAAWPPAWSKHQPHRRAVLWPAAGRLLVRHPGPARARAGRALRAWPPAWRCNLALAYGLGAQLFWMWWNITGLVVAVLVTWRPAG
jgi:Na+/proline symporter